MKKTAVFFKKYLLPYFILMRFHRPVGVVLLLWPTLWALWIAGYGHPSSKNIIIFLLGVIVTRAAGCVINDIADRQFDRHVARTKNRPLTANQIPVSHALVLLFFLCVFALILVCLTNALTVQLAFVAVIIAAIYPFMKRFTHWPQVVLGIAYSMSIPMAFAAQTEVVPLAAFILFFANIAWTIAYDTEYAMVDREDDIKIGIKSTAILFGQYDRIMIGVFQGIFLSMLCVLGLLLSFPAHFFLLLIPVVGLFFYQHYLIQDRIPVRCFSAFLNNQWVGAWVWIVVVSSSARIIFVSAAQ